MSTTLWPRKPFRHPFNEAVTASIPPGVSGDVIRQMVPDIIIGYRAWYSPTEHDKALLAATVPGFDPDATTAEWSRVKAVLMGYGIQHDKDTTIDQILIALAIRGGAQQLDEQISKPGDKPQWNQERRELHFGKTLLRKYRQAAPNQEKVLGAFQEEEWPQRVYDPLDPGKLSETLRQLNKHQKILAFEADGTGEGILWSVRANR